MIIIFYVLILLFSVIVHEISHGYVALMLGDKTAKDAGRLTLNPIKHLDVFGSVVVPALLFILQAPIFGWAKPVPYDPRFLKNPRQAAGLIAAAGPLSNFTIALIFSLIVRYLANLPYSEFTFGFLILSTAIIQVNIALGFFNLIPIPPLDGSKVLFAFLPRGLEKIENIFNQYGFFVLLLLIFSGVSFLGPLISNTYQLLIGSRALQLLSS